MVRNIEFRLVQHTREKAPKKNSAETEKAQKFYEVSANDKQACEINSRAVRQSLKLKHQIPNLFHSDEFREFSCYSVYFLMAQRYWHKKNKKLPRKSRNLLEISS